MAAAVLLAGCGDGTPPGRFEGRPGGPYHVTLTLDPPRPEPGAETLLEFRLSHARSGAPVADLQLAHERLVHNFIVSRDFSAFAHIHHEDFAPVTDADRASGTLRFPYRFPVAGRYRIVSEFARNNRPWTKHFDVTVGEGGAAPPVEAGRNAESGPYAARLTVTPAEPSAGRVTDLVLHLARDGVPVTNLALHLGSELHGAVWREDGANFGHLHSYTPKVAAIMALAHDRAVPTAERGARIAEMMVQLMCLESELVFEGPEVPIRYVFPDPGRYYLFLEVAPGGTPRVFRFAFDVAAAEMPDEVASRDASVPAGQGT